MTMTAFPNAAGPAGERRAVGIRRARIGLALGLLGALAAGAGVRVRQAALQPSAASSMAGQPPLADAASSSASAPRDIALLPLPERMARAIDIPSIKGVVRGTTGAPTTRTVDQEKRYGGVVTDYPFTVAAFSGKGESPYPIGRSITLRVPGGRVGNLSTAFEGAPRMASGQDLFVFVRDQGTVAGGNTATVLVASDGTDVLEVRNGTVHGKGGWSGFTAPVATFPLLFKR